MWSYNRTILELKLKFRHEKQQYATLIIAPFWNWNGFISRIVAIRPELIIAPFWNWNLFWCFKRWAAYTYNRTILELKQRTANSRVKSFWAYNRTILELKLNMWILSVSFSPTYNRTILELKPLINLPIGIVTYLIIAPFWNWNQNIVNNANQRHLLIIAPFWNWNKVKYGLLMIRPNL